MARDITRLMTKIHDAGVAGDAWPDALTSLTETLGAAGAACIVFNKRTGRAEWVCFSGLSAELQSDYMNYYASLDPYSPLLDVDRRWTKLSECFSDSFLRRNEWYNDFVLACGVRDILGARLVDTPTHTMIFGLHQQIGRQFGDNATSVLGRVTGPLGSAAFQQVERLFSGADHSHGVDDAVDGKRYFFHVSNGRRYPDDTGKLFSTLAEAIAYASDLARELGQDEGWDGFVISVTDIEGQEIVRMPVRS